MKDIEKDVVYLLPGELCNFHLKEFDLRIDSKSYSKASMVYFKNSRRITLTFEIKDVKI